MKITIALFASIHVFANVALAHPFIIFKTHVVAAAVLPPAPTHHYIARQNLLDDLQNAANSLLGISTSSTKRSSTSSSARTTSSSSSSSVSVRTIVPATTASSSTSSARQRVTSSSSTDDSDSQTSTTSSDDSSTQTSTVSSTVSSTTTSVTSTISTSTSSTSTSATSTATGNIAEPAPTSSQSSDNGGVPPGGIAVAVIMSLLVLGVTAWLIFRYHPKCRAWWAAREAKKFEARSYRDAIDGPGSSSLRSHAMSAGPTSRRQTILKSFFAPPTVQLGNGQEIRRKPVNWGADAKRTPSMRFDSPTPPPPAIDMEKIPVDSERIPMTAAAAPMGQIERYSYIPKAQPQHLSAPAPERIPELPAKISELPAQSPPVPAKIPQPPPKTRSSAVSPMSMHPNEDIERLPPISPLSSHRGVASRELPELPPVPMIPALNVAKRGSDGVFRLS